MKQLNEQIKNQNRTMNKGLKGQKFRVFFEAHPLSMELNAENRQWLIYFFAGSPLKVKPSGFLRRCGVHNL